MEILPAIDIKGGKCVRLTQGDFTRETIYFDDPSGVAAKWRDEGAKILHIVDLDGAKIGLPQITNEVKKIIRITGLPIQVGGGVRSIESIKILLDAGVSRIIVGTVAVENSTLLKKMIEMFGEKIVVSLDSRNGELLTKGWLENSRKSIIESAKNIASLGVKKIINTDVTRDGMLTEPNYTILENLVKETGVSIIAAGGVSSMESLIKLKNIGCGGAIIGKALYENKLHLKKIMEKQW